MNSFKIELQITSKLDKDMIAEKVEDALMGLAELYPTANWEVGEVKATPVYQRKGK